MAKIGVYLGSLDVSPLYTNAALLLGQEIAARGHVLICGASGSGMMGELIGSAIDAGGVVIGVLPREIASNEIPHPSLTHIHSVPSVSDRKKAIRDLSDIIITLPGGIGTLDEFFETYMLKKSNLYSKPIGLLNIGNFYKHLIAHIDVIVTEGFSKAKHRALFTYSSDVVELLESLLTQIRPSENLSI